MKLIQLPITGNWIDPTDIKQITSVPWTGTEEYTHSDRVVVKCGESHHIITCKSKEQADVIRDELAAIVNKAIAESFSVTN